MITEDVSILLASASPRRRQIIATLGLPFHPGVAPGDEDRAQEAYQGPAEGLAQWTATYKALMIFSQPAAQPQIVITADTTVILDDQVLGKPRDAEHARQLLTSLRGRWHRVVTGVVVSTLHDGKLEIHGESRSTPVLMRDYTDQEIKDYIATGDPMDKAGAYGIQHPGFQPTQRIDGCYLNVVGLPLCTLVDLLARFSIQPVNRRCDGCEGSACPWSQQCQHSE